MFKTIFTQAALVHFILYFIVGVGMTWLFSRLYIYMTPHNELKEIESGKVAPSISLFGASLGFAFPLFSAALHAAHLVEFIVWGMLAGLIQVAVFWSYYYTHRAAWESMFRESNANVAQALHYAGICVIIGLFNAAALVP